MSNDKTAWAMTVGDEATVARRRTVDRAAAKLNRWMLPFVLLFSVIASIDRANLAFASLDMSAELGFTASDYGLGAAIFFVAYSAFQVPMNVMFLYLGGRMMLGLIAVCWGLVAASMAAVTDKWTFLAVRLLLGVAEAGTVPGIWAYLSQMYPSSHLTLPTTFYMAGITAAQAIGAPLAAGLLSMHGLAGLSGWRWLFVIEGVPSIFLGIAIWMLLPRDVAHSSLSEEEKQHMQAAISNPSTDGKLPTAAGSEGVVAFSSTAPPSARRVLHDLGAALRHRVVWCASGWRFLYLLTLNGLIYWVPLIVYDMLGVKGHANAAHADPKAMLLTAVPYIAGMLTHIVNAYHSKRVGERRFHIAVLWLWGGAVLCTLPVAWMHSAHHAAFALLVLACMGVMGCDGVDVSWIISLMQSLTSSQQVLAMACINMLANFGGFAGSYLNGYLKEQTGQYFVGMWVMGGVMVLAAACVSLFPLSWVTGGSALAAQSSQQQEAREVVFSKASGRSAGGSAVVRADAEETY